MSDLRKLIYYYKYNNIASWFIMDLTINKIVIGNIYNYNNILDNSPSSVKEI